MADQALLQYLEGFISEERRQRFIDVLSRRTRYLTIVMEDIFQLHNTSAVLRSCEVFGVQDVHLIESRFGRQVDSKIALGAQQWVDLYRYPDAGACIDHLQSKGYAIVATTPGSDGISLDDFRPNRPSALFFGTEKEGLSEQVLNAAEERLHIPMAGFTESLNVSVSVAIVLYRLTNALRDSGIDWPLTQEEILEKRLDWTMKSVRSVNSILRRYRQEH